MRYEDDFEEASTLENHEDVDSLSEADTEADTEGSFAEPIAVIGFAGRFPGARNVAQFWTNLRDGIESVKFFTDEELLAENIDPAILKNPRFVRADAVLDDIDLFDADFFNYSPREAEITDPQHRLFLECAWEAMEHSGYNHETYPGRVGVFGGSGLSSYLIRNLLKNSDYVESVGSFQTMLANSQDFLTTKVSYKMNLMGPSINVNTLCSSSMVGVHLACQSLWNYQTDMNLAGGVSIQSSRNEAFFYQEGGIGAFDGHCRAFDERAGGTVSGSGLGIVVLKRLEDAIADGDTVHALVRGSAINNDGSVKMSYTAPSIDGQAEVIGEAMALGGIDPSTITYVECHGTGTALGDPIEITGLTKAFRAYTDKKVFCAIGSVKTNIGHLVTAGGVASMIKTVMALKHRLIPPSLNFERPNPKIDFASSPFFVNTQLREWVNSEGGPLRAGVSSFGIGGTNAHLILEEAPAPEATTSDRPFQLIPFSARTETALAAARAQLARHLADHPELSFEDAAYTMRVGRKTFSHRGFVVAESAEQAVAALDDLGSRAVLSQFQENEGREVAFLFSGQGSQYVGMAQSIYASEPVFREAFDACAEGLKPHLGLDIREVIWPANESSDQTERLQQTSMTQPALFAIAYAQATLMKSWGIQPSAMLGHSIGEYVAAHLAGVFSLADALKIVALRGRLINGLPAGDMLAVPVAESVLVPLLGPGIALAAVNGRASCVVSGTAEQVEAFRVSLSERGIEARLLHTSHAFHSHMMEPILPEFASALGQVALSAPELPFVSNVTGTWITDEQATDPQYWVRHLRGTVRFNDGLTTLVSNASRVLLEVGPGNTLTTLARQFQAEKRLEAFASIRHPREKHNDAAFLQNTVGQLWLAGVSLDWDGFHQDQVRVRVPMPTYPFERRRFWIAPDMFGFQTGTGASAAADEKLLGVRKDELADWFYVPTWRSTALPKVLGQLPPKHRWLVFGETRGLTRHLMGRLQDEGQVVVNVAPGTSFSKLEHGLYQVRIDEPADYAALVADLQTEGLLPQSLIFFPGQERTAPTGPLASVTHAVTAMAAAGHEAAMRLTVVTHGLWSLDPALADPNGGMVAGLLKVIPHEYPHIVCRTIDMSLPKQGSWRERFLAEQLLTDLTGDRYDVQVAYHGAHRLVRGFEASRLDAVSESKSREGKTYLVLGGLHGAGLKMAQQLASKERVNLVLTSEEDFPDRAHWDQPSPNFGETIQVLKGLEAAGHKLLVRPCNLADGPQLVGLLAESRSQFGEIRGVIFGQGPGGRDVLAPLSAMSKPGLDYLTWLGQALPQLATALGETQRDFVVLLSSTASELGGLGLGVYAAANAYCDAFVRCHNAQAEQPWTSLNWDGWLASAERSAGMGERHTKLAISWAEGSELFERVIGHGILDQMAVSTEDLPARLRQQTQNPALLEQKVEKVIALHARPSLTNAYVAPRTETEQKVAEIWQRFLGIENVGINDNYFDLGGDSLLIVKIRRALQEAFEGDLLTTDLFEHPTVGALATFFDQSKDDSSTQNAKDRAAKQRAAMEEEEAMMRQSRRRTRR